MRDNMHVAILGPVENKYVEQLRKNLGRRVKGLRLSFLNPKTGTLPDADIYVVQCRFVAHHWVSSLKAKLEKNTPLLHCGGGASRTAREIVEEINNMELP